MEIKIIDKVRAWSMQCKIHQISKQNYIFDSGLLDTYAKTKNIFFMFLLETTTNSPFKSKFKQHGASFYLVSVQANAKVLAVPATLLIYIANCFLSPTDM